MSTKCSIPGSWLNSSVQKLVLAPCVKQGVFKRHIILSVKRLFWLYLAQGARAGKGFNKLHQEVQHHHGAWVNSLDHPQCSDKSQSFEKINFLILGGPKKLWCSRELSSHPDGVRPLGVIHLTLFLLWIPVLCLCFLLS